MNIQLPIKEISIIRLEGTDKIVFRCEGPSPFPEMAQREPGRYDPGLVLDCRAGYAEEWLSRAGFANQEVALITSKGAIRVRAVARSSKDDQKG